MNPSFKLVFYFQTTTHVSTNVTYEDATNNNDDDDEYDDDDNGITIIINDEKNSNTESTPTVPEICVTCESESNETKEPETEVTQAPQTTTDQERPGLNMFRKLKTCLDSTRLLIGSLRREKGRLMKRELSVECRMGEIEDYKTHMKEDLVGRRLVPHS